MIWFALSFFLFLVLGIPISICVGASAVVACLTQGYPLFIIGQKMVSGLDSFLLVAVPLFVLSGNLMNAGKITEKIFNFAKEIVGWIPGGLGQANVMASVIFAGNTGSAAADAAGLGTIEMEAMTSNGYDREFSAGVSASSSIIGAIFPPSIPMIIYSSIASVSVARLFLGGVFPGLLIAFTLMILVLIMSIKRKYPRTRFSLRSLVKELFSSFFSLLDPIIILGGLFFGWFTPTEAASIAVIYSIFLAIVVYRTMEWKAFKKALLESALVAANSMMIVGSSTLFAYVLIMEGTSDHITNFFLGITTNPYMLLLIINVVLLIIGMFMEPGALLTLMVPILVPIARSVNLDMVHFGVVVVINLMIGQVTPPFGVCLFIISDVGKIKLDALFKAILPFLIPLIVTLFLCTYIPPIILWLPNLLFGQ